MKRALVNREEHIQDAWCSQCGKIWPWGASASYGEKLEVIIEFGCKRCKKVNRLLLFENKVFVISKKLLNKKSLMNSLSSSTRNDILENINKEPLSSGAKTKI